MCASFVHFTTYWTIGNTTCTEYNVVSQIKFASTLIIAYSFFDADSVVFSQIFGDVIALCGIIIYTHLKVCLPGSEFEIMIDELRTSFFDCERLVEFLTFSERAWHLKALSSSQQLVEITQERINRRDRVVFPMRRV